MPAAMIIEEKDEPRVKFERPLNIKVMSIDGTGCEKGHLIHISDYEALIELTGRAFECSEFFLLLTGFGNPVFRRCERNWTHGTQIGVKFKGTSIGIKSEKELPKLASREFI